MLLTQLSLLIILTIMLYFNQELSGLENPQLLVLLILIYGLLSVDT
nr:MAG TPA: hypothetical protein [Bacteriophage sp.]